MPSASDGSFGVGFGYDPNGGSDPPPEAMRFGSLRGWPALVVALRAIQRASLVIELFPVPGKGAAETAELFTDAIRRLEYAIRIGTIPAIHQIGLLTRIENFLQRVENRRRIEGAGALVTAIRTLLIVIPTNPPPSQPQQYMSITNAVALAIDLVLRSAIAPIGFGLREGIDQDVALLEALTKQPEWDALYPIDPDVCGPLFTTPHRAPKSEPLRFESGFGGMAVEIEVPDDASEEQIAGQVADYLSRLNRLHRAIGGHGLRVVPPIEVTQTSPTVAGVCS